MIRYGNILIDKIFLGTTEITKGLLGKVDVQDYLPYIISEDSIELDCAGTAQDFQIQSNTNYTINSI